MSQDLSRRDDLISWFYLSFELIIGPLPWRRCADKSQILYYKENFEIRHRVDSKAPELFLIWQYIAKLGFFDAPNYSLIYGYLTKLMKRMGFNMTDPFDWSELIHRYRQSVAASFLDGKEGKPLANVEEVALLGDGGLTGRLLSPNITVPPPFSHLSEPDDCGCCC
jgi:hypothetical protein